jgi:uncharacterized protein (TIGR03083 family)
MARSWDVAADLPAFDVRPLLAAERSELLGLLHMLGDDEWSAGTVCTGWSVHDVALHLLGNDLGRLGQPSAAALAGAETFEELAATIEQSNEAWVATARAMIPATLVPDLLALTGGKLDVALATVDLQAPGVAVRWTGSGPTPCWLDLAREYTERWLHQAQIREAVGRQPLQHRRWLHPVIDTFVRALPQAYDDVAAQVGTSVAFVVTGDAGGRWWLRRGPDRWHLEPAPERPADATVELPADAAWRFMARLGDVDAARASAVITGSRALGEPALSAVAVMTSRPLAGPAGRIAPRGHSPRAAGSENHVA